MRQYLDFLRHILTGRWSDNRTGTRTIKQFGWQMRFDLRQGFPLVTTKKVHIPSIVHELLWFLHGDTNTTYLNTFNVRIWNEWALQENQTQQEELDYQERIQLYAIIKGITEVQAFDRMYALTTSGNMVGALDELDKAGIQTHREVIVRAMGELGPVYGGQWRSWGTGQKDHHGREITIDQIRHVVEQLKTNPNSRRILVSAWNVRDLPDEGVSPQDNVKNGKQALAPCHVMFQFGTTPLTLDERVDILIDRFEKARAINPSLTLDDDVRAYYEYKIEHSVSDADMAQYLDEQNIPKYLLNCHLYQRKQHCALAA